MPRPISSMVRVAMKDGTFSVDPAKVKEAVVELSRDLLTLEAKGNRDDARALMD